jgi:predicted transcriptional regulator
MQIITTREFRANQKKYFEMAEKETILVSRRNAAPIMVCAVRDEDFPSREELAAIQRGIEDIRSGNTFKMEKNESLNDFLNRIEDEGNV